MHPTKYMQCGNENKILPRNKYRVTILSYGDPICDSVSGARMNNSARPARPHERRRDVHSRLPSLLVLLSASIFCLLGPALRAQDWVKTGTGLGVDKVRLAV